jgi:hypothetical protein
MRPAQSDLQNKSRIARNPEHRCYCFSITLAKTLLRCFSASRRNHTRSRVVNPRRHIAVAFLTKELLNLFTFFAYHSGQALNLGTRLVGMQAQLQRFRRIITRREVLQSAGTGRGVRRLPRSIPCQGDGHNVTLQCAGKWTGRNWGCLGIG